MRTLRIVGIIVSGLILAGGSCNEQASEPESAIEAAGDAMEEAGKSMGEAAAEAGKDAVEATGDAVEDAGKAIKDSVND